MTGAGSIENDIFAFSCVRFPSRSPRCSKAFEDSEGIISVPFGEDMRRHIGNSILYFLFCSFSSSTSKALAHSTNRKNERQFPQEFASSSNGWVTLHTQFVHSPNIEEDEDSITKAIPPLAKALEEDLRASSLYPFHFSIIFIRAWKASRALLSPFRFPSDSLRR